MTERYAQPRKFNHEIGADQRCGGEAHIRRVSEDLLQWLRPGDPVHAGRPHGMNKYCKIQLIHSLKERLEAGRTERLAVNVAADLPPGEAKLFHMPQFFQSQID